LIGNVIINCNITLSHLKKWVIYKVNEKTGQISKKIKYTHPSISSSELIVNSKSLPYGLYRFDFTVKKDCLYSEIDTYVKIVPSGLMISSLSQMTGMYGELIQITRGEYQEIKFNPFLHTYDLDNLAVITSLTFKYACQLIDANIEQGYPKLVTQSNELIYLDDFKFNASIDQSILQCFNSTGV
jgi:hypothetical protein